MEETVPRSCPMTGFGISSAECLDLAPALLDNACYHLVQNILSSCLLRKTPDSNVYKIWFLTQSEKRILGCVCV
jgi:hypothetical protein